MEVAVKSAWVWVCSEVKGSILGGRNSVLTGQTTRDGVCPLVFLWARQRQLETAGHDSPCDHVDESFHGRWMGDMI